MNDRAELPDNEAGEVLPQRGMKVLEFAVYSMGVLLVLALFALVGGIIWKFSNRNNPPAVETKVLDLGLPAGTQVRSMELYGDRLAIDTGGDILVIDTKQNRVISRIVIAPK